MPDNADNASGNLGPWWISVIQTVGPTAAIAIFLVWVMASQVTPALDSIKGFMAEHVQQMQSMADNQVRQTEEIQKQWTMIGRISTQEHQDRERALAINQQTCINSAKSAYQSQKCIDARNVGEAAEAATQQ